MQLRGTHITTILLLCALTTTLTAQKDSLLNILRNTADLEIKHTLTGKIYWQYLYEEVDFSDSITTYSIRLAEEADSDSLRCVSLHMKANVKLVKAEYDSSLYYVNQIHEIAERNDYLPRVATSYALEGLLHYYKGEFNKSLEKHFAALEIQRAIGAVDKQALSLSNIGISFERLGEYKEAISYYDQALLITPESDTYSRASLLCNTGMVHTSEGDYEAAMTTLLQAKSLLKKDDHVSLLNDVDNGLAIVYKKTGDLTRAMLLAKQIQQRAIEAKDIFRQVRMHEFLGSIFLEQAAYKSAIDQYETAIVLGAEKEVGESALHTYENIKKAYQATGDTKRALIAADSVISISQALFNKEKKTIVENLNVKYQTAIKDQKLQQAQQGNIVKTYQRNIAISGFLCLLALGAFLWQRMKSKQLAQQKLEMIQKQRIEDLEKERKILSMSAMLEGQEKERYRIAQDLHDGLGSLLASVKAHFSIIQGEIKQLEKLNIFDKAQEMMDNACDEVRRISHNLMPPILTTQGLPNALQNLVADYTLTHDLNISIDIQRMDTRLSTSKEIVLYRVCQELLTNIHKHAKATEVEISLYGLDENVQLIIEDNGVGFDSLQVPPGIGLMSMQSRVNFVGGQVDVDSIEQQGTTISISIPR